LADLIAAQFFGHSRSKRPEDLPLGHTFNCRRHCGILELYQFAKQEREYNKSPEPGVGSGL